MSADIEAWMRDREQKEIELDRRIRALGSGIGASWENFGPNYPNVPQTNNFSRFLRIGNTVWVRSSITLTGAIGPALIDMPFPFYSGTLINDSYVIGRVRAIRTGVAWYNGDICPIQLAGPSRAAVYLNNTSGAQWTNGTPAFFLAGDRWGFEYMFEAAPL